MIRREQLGRYTLLRKLGEGAFGVVYEAHDPFYDCRIALKVLRRNQVSDVFRFKQEFRGLADVLHRNLVRLYELALDGDTWYFTMELVEGCGLAEYLWTGMARPTAATATMATATAADQRPATSQRPPVDAARLRGAVLGLCEGVEALHRAGKLHCDIKPSNVLVSADGRVVLLDFGLITDIDAQRSGERGIAGTPGYIAPERFLRQPPSRATDWFSVGVLLYEALTGHAPSAGGQLAFPDDGSELSDLYALCASLLRHNPDQRPTGTEILRVLGAEVAQPRVSQAVTPNNAFFGRLRELDELRAAWLSMLSGQGTVLVRVVGSSGSGKTALARQFLQQTGEAHPGALLLTGRCYEAETVPYKALDSLMDALGRHLADLPTSELRTLLPRGAAVLVRLFRAFEQVVPSQELGQTDPVETQAQRRHAFSLLRELIRRIAERRPVALFLDDLHWGDADSAKLLIDLLRPPDSPRVLVIAVHRPMTTPNDFLAALDELQLEQRVLELSHLRPSDAEAMASHLLGSEEAALAADIAREAAGSPIFIQQLVEYAGATRGPNAAGPTSFNELIMQRLGELETEAQHLLEAVATASQPIPERVALEAAQLQGGPGRSAALTVRRARLLTTRSEGDAVIFEPVHDRVREALIAALAPEAKRGYHARLAQALLTHTQADPEVVLPHFIGAGDHDNTRRYAVRAAERADAAFAFDRAARHYQLVVELTAHESSERRELLRRWGEALTNSGRAAEAADTFQEAVEAAGPDAPGSRELIELSRRAAELALRSGRLELGTRRMHAVLHKVGVEAPRSYGRATALSVLRRARVFARGLQISQRATPSPEQLARLEALWGASTSLSMINYVVADALGLQHLIEALDHGARAHIVRALGYEAAFEAVIGGKFLLARVRKILAQMDAFAAESDHPYDKAWALMSRGITSWFSGDWPTTWKYVDAAALLYRERCRGVAWELAVCDAYRMPALAYLGELKRLSELVPSALEAAMERGDLFNAATLRMGQQSMTFLIQDRPGQAIEHARVAAAGFEVGDYVMQHYHHLFAYVQASLYTGDVAEAWRRVMHDWPLLKQSRLLASQYLRVEIRHLRARTALVQATSLPARQRDELQRIAEQDARDIARDAPLPCAGLAATLHAALAHARKQEAESQRQLRAAIAGFDAAQMAAYAAAARLRLGQQLGGSAGAELCDRARHWMSAQGVLNPDAMTDMLVPWPS